MSTVIRKNERSWAIDLISEINIMLSTMGLLIKKAGGESTLSTGKISMFPDVLLYADTSHTKVVQGWELKLPDTSITDQTFIKDAERKAKALGLNSFFIWNFSAGVLYVKNSQEIFEPIKSWIGTNHIKTREDVNTYKSDWLPTIKEIIIEINEFLTDGKLKSSEIGTIINNNLMLQLIDRNKAILAEFIKAECVKKAEIQSYLNLWWSEVKSEYVSDEPTLYFAYSKVILLNWTNRIVFAHLIKRYHNIARRVEEINNLVMPNIANEIFENITGLCDFYNIFSPIKYNTIVSDSVWQDIVDFNMFLTGNGIEHIEQSSLQAVLENSVSMAKREIRGQFTTPRILADLLVRITVSDWTGPCADLCCGTGTIAKALLDEKISKIGIKQAYESTWASDKYSFPLQIANLGLTGAEAIDIPCLLFQNNVFELYVGYVLSVTNPKDGKQIEIELPSFGAVVSNLPFVPFEHITKDDLDFIESIKNETKQGRVILGGKGDIYSYIPFAIWHLLGNNGRLGIITSNSWLGTDWGQPFFELLTHYFTIRSVVISGVGRWFNNADVVTTLIVLEKKNIATPPLDNVINFCVLRKTLTELASSTDEMDKAVDSLVLSKEIDKNILGLKRYSLSTIKTLNKLGVSNNALFHNVEWLVEISDKLRPITDLFKVTRGERRGWNDMFYPESNHGIEPEYIRPVLKSPRNLKSLLGETDIVAFCCHRSIAELQAKGHIGAIKWIKKFENVTNGTGVPLTQSLRKTNAFWYEMDDSFATDMVTILNPNIRLFVSRFDEPTFVDQRFTRLNKVNDNVNLELCHALLNSMLGMFYIEAVGFGRGLGVLDTSSTNFKKIYMFNPDMLTQQQVDAIIEAFSPLLLREIKNTEEELLSPDRIAFDKLILECYGLSKYYEPIKNSLLSMQRARLAVNK